MAYRNIAEASAYRISPKKKKEEEGSPIEQYKKAFLQSLESYDTKQKKPVRWNFFKDNEGLFMLSQQLDPFYKAMDTLSKIKTGKSIYDPITKKISERDYVDGFADLAKGLDTGTHELTSSIGELLFMGTDFLTNKNFVSDFQKSMKKIKPDEPETWRGDL